MNNDRIYDPEEMNRLFDEGRAQAHRAEVEHYQNDLARGLVAWFTMPQVQDRDKKMGLWLERPLPRELEW